ncbi:MAG: hypothetical protein KC454_10525 [Flavobacteriales bacterium]|nr:hypothetical protein [Flavobacteriales bacterium]
MKKRVTAFRKIAFVKFFLVIISMSFYSASAQCPDASDPSNICASSGVDGGNANSFMDTPTPYTSIGSLPIQPQPDYFDNTEGVGACSTNGWENETGTSANDCSLMGITSPADCIVFQDDNQCDQMVWTMPVTLDNPFCVNFTMQTEGPGTDDAGIAFTMFSSEGLSANDEPCQLQINSCGSGQSNGAGSAIDGGLGYAPTFENAYVPGGALTVEFDIDNNSGVLGSDDDFTGCSEHVSINEDGCIQEYLVGECANFNDGLCHDVEICWDPNSGTGLDGLLTVSIDGTTITGLDEDITSYFSPHNPAQVSGSSGYEVYFAFTAGYEGSFGDNDGSQSYVCDFYMDYTVPVPAAAPPQAGPPQSSNCIPEALPVELGELSSRCDGDRELVFWDTESESEVSHFELEYTYNDMVFFPIKEISAAGTSLIPQNYQVALDTDNEKQRYYRLKIVDFNGDIEYSEFIASKSCGGGLVDLIQSVKQIDNQLIIGLNEPAELSLLDNLGKTYYKSSNSNSSQSFPIYDLANGMYYINALTYSGEFQTWRVLISR